MKVRVLAVIVCMMAAVNFASADTIRGIEMDFVTIGNAGNAGEQSGLWHGDTAYYGAVGYNYRIGKYEVTNAQWNAFTAAAGAPTGNPSYAYDNSASFTDALQPTNMISWYEASQFCNYLTSGDKSKGAYQFSGNNTNPGNFLGIDRVSSISTYGTTYVIPTEDEWYKAAYYKPDGSGYSLYANGTNTAPIAGVQSNYQCTICAPWNVGTGTQEQNSTFDMMGNVWEWNETLFDDSAQGSASSALSIRGGWYDYVYGYAYDVYGSYDYYLRSYGRQDVVQWEEGKSLGFRVASVPEPCSLVLLSLGGLALLRNRRFR